jgi:hypothetical protein
MIDINILCPAGAKWRLEEEVVGRDKVVVNFL